MGVGFSTIHNKSIYVEWAFPGCNKAQQTALRTETQKNDLEVYNFLGLLD